MFTDKPSEIDLLDRLEFAKGIAKSLFTFSQKNSDGFVTAITGKWGSGKSTLLSFIVKELRNHLEKNNASFEFVHFNPWMFLNESDIHNGFLAEYMKAFEGYEKAKKNEKSKVLRHKIAKGVTDAFPYAKSLSSEIENSLKKYTEKKSLTYKKEIDELLLESKRKIIVCIDDIDRLPPGLIFQLFQLLKLTCNFKNTFYLIAYDREAVELSIETQFKDYGKKFLDKIVQAEFLVPEIKKEKIQQIFFDEIQKILSELEIHIDIRTLNSIWNFHKLKHYFKTLRDVYRYLSSIRLSLPLIQSEINVTDFLLIEAIRINDFDVYNMIFEEYGRIIFSFGNPDAFSDKNRLEEIENLTTRELVSYLFPFKPNVYSNKGKKRIYESMFFERYFSLQINKTDILQAELGIIFNNSMNRVLFLQRILNEGRFENFLSRFNDEVELKHQHNLDFKLIEDFFDFFSMCAEQIERKDALSDTIVNLLSLNSENTEEYYRLFFAKLLSPVNYFDKGRIYFFHFLLSSKTKSIEMPTLWNDFIKYCIDRFDLLEKFYKEFMHICVGDVFRNNLIQQPDSYYTKAFILDYCQLFHEEYLEILQKLFNKRENLFTFCRYILGSFDDGPFRFDINKLNSYIPKLKQDSFYQQLKSLDEKTLSRSEIRAIKFLTKEK